MNLILVKDILYLVGSILGIIGFIRTLNKRDKCELNYRTELEDEAHPFLVCIRGDMFNLSIRDKEQSVWTLKYGSTVNLSQVKYEGKENLSSDKSCFSRY